MRKLILLPFWLVFFTSCIKNAKNITAADVTVEIYKVASTQYSTTACAIDTGSAVLESTPFVEEKEILSYDKDRHVYKLTDDAANRINVLAQMAPLAVTINKIPVYYFLHVPLYTNSSCSGSIVAHIKQNELFIDMGYIYVTPTVADQRNDERLLMALKAKGKM